MPGNDLQGVRILVTRPAEQASQLMKLIKQHAATAIPLPLIEIEPVQNSTHLAEMFSHIQSYDLLIFVSANAVQHVQPYISTDLLASIHIGAIGRATARQLEQWGITAQFLPENYDSESFLALPAMQVMHGKRVLIVRGEGGREKLAQELRARGAEVDYAEVYRRVVPDVQISDRLSASDVDVITITSGEALSNLALMARQQNLPWIFEKALIVIHDRIASLAKELGFKQVARVTDEVSDEAIIRSLLQWQQNQGV